MIIDFKSLLKENPFILAPMDDVTDICFRELCESHHCSYSVSELTSVDALIRDKTFKSRYSRGNLKINCIQLFGKDVKSFVAAAKKVENECDIIDINFGCPSPNVTRQESGSFLLNDPEKVSEIVRSVVNAVNIPVTCKIRLGYNNYSHLEIAKEIELAGASMIAVHGRTAKQKYGGVADWEAIKEVHDTLNIPVIGNGDVKCEEDIDKYLGKYCSGLMIGRAAIGNPLIFERFYYYFKTGKKLVIENLKEKQKELFLQYLKLIENYEFYNLDLKVQRQAMWFFKGISGVKEFRTELSGSKSYDEVLKIVDKF